MPDPAPAVLHRNLLLKNDGAERRTNRSSNAAGPPVHQHQQQALQQPSNGEASKGVHALEIAPALEDAGTLHLGGASSFKGAGRYRLLYACVCAAAFVNAMTFSVLGPFLPAYLEERFGSASTQVGMIMAAYPAVTLVSSPMVGYLMNRCGRWYVLFAGLGTLAASTALYGVATTVPCLYVASGLHGASLSLIHVSSLGLVSAFPERITESMSGIEVWSGVALIIGPPLGGMVFSFGGVPTVFLAMALFPVGLLLLAPRVRQLVLSLKDDPGETGSSTTVSFWRVARSRGVLAGAFVTAYNYGVIGFLEVALAPHLDRTLSTSPRSIGFVFVIPSVVYTVMAMKADSIVDRHGVKKTLLWGLTTMGLSLILFGPSPALATALVTRPAARGAIGAGLMMFQVGSALASVPAFTAMQASVGGMGRGADNLVASLHSMSIGVGEVIGPLLGGFMLENMPVSPAFACDPDAVATLHEEPALQELPGHARALLAEFSASQAAHTDTTNKGLVEVPSFVGRNGSDDDNGVEGGRDRGRGGEVHRVLMLGEYKHAVWRELFLNGDVDGEGKVLSGVDDGGGGGSNKVPFEGISVGAGDAVVAPLVGGEQQIARDEVREPASVVGPDAPIGNEGSVVEEKGDGGVEGAGVKAVREGGGTGVRCDTAFPLATTVLGWASGFAMLAMYRLIPSPAKGRSGAGAGSSVRLLDDAVDAA